MAADRRARLERLRDRFLALSLRSRSLCLTRASATGALDLTRLSAEAKRLLWLVKVLGQEEAPPNVLAEVAAGDDAGALSLDVATLAHAARDERMQTGEDSLSVGWPFLEGRAPDGTWLRAPLLLFPVALGQTDRGRLSWTIAPAGPAEINEPLLQTLTRSAGVRLLPADLAATVDNGAFRVDDPTWKALAAALQEGGLALSDTPPSLPPAEPLLPRDKAAREAAPKGRFRLAFHMVLGRFPAAASTLVLDYDTLLEGALDDAHLGLAGRLLELDDEDLPTTARAPELPPAPADPTESGPLRRWQPLASDASQDAIFRFLESHDSGGLVVQGPPGTGKSQLIANLVAASVARGERVLLVCQKRAALDVVADRLGALGLRDPVAIVHDVRRDRNAVCAAVADTLDEALDEAMTRHDALASGFERATDAHQRAEKKVAGLLAASQASWLVLAGSRRGRPGLVELDERALGARDDVALPALDGLVADLGDDDLLAAGPLIDDLAPVAAPLAPPHPLAARAGWRDRDDAALDLVFGRLQRLEGALAAWRAVAGGGHLDAGALDALARALSRASDLLRLLDEPDAAEVSDLLTWWARTGGDPDHDLWGALAARLDEARASLRPVPPELLRLGDAELDGRALRLDQLAALEGAWFRGLVPRFWSLRRYRARVVATFAGPLPGGGAAALAALHRDALPWHDLLAELPPGEPLRELLLAEPPGDLERAAAVVTRRRAQLAAARDLRLHLAPHGGPYAAPPDLAGATALTDAPFFAALATDAARVTALARVDAALGALRDDLAPAALTALGRLTRADPAAAHAQAAALANARPDGARAAAIDRALEAAPAYARAFLRAYAPAPGVRPSEAARWAVEAAWREALLDGRPRAAVEAPAVRAERHAELAAAVGDRQKLAVGAILAAYRRQLLDAAQDDAQRTRLQKLSGEARKRRYRATLRQLIERHWHTGLALARPVWLCSPESVSTMFPLERDLFDLVIFDEASQCPVESAMPALVRTRRALIAGDDQQMPPSHFFQATVAEEADFGDDGELLASHSILQLARVAFPGTTLRWHYRCRHEPLIAFSNAAFYGRRLATVPNAERRAVAPWEGVRFEAVPGRWVEQTNPIEAEHVVDALGRILAADLPGGGPPSVGVVTFNKKQAELVSGLIEARASLDAEFRARILRDRGRAEIDQVFVRNLENVQGDERDVILMSVGYGASEPGGPVHARFGPLGQEGGEKRLNVAITRARLALHVFASFTPGALDVSGTAHPGPKLLLAYLRYARAVTAGDESALAACLADAALLGGGRGVAADARGASGERPGLALRDALATALDERGYRVKKALGLGRLSLDLGVAALDDPAFHVGVDTSAWLEERDPLTRDLYVPKFWERLGWTLLRVTPGQWKAERAAVLAAVDDAVRG